MNIDTVNSNIDARIEIQQQQQDVEAPERRIIGASHTSLPPKAQLEIEKGIMKKHFNLQDDATLRILKTETLIDENEKVIGRSYVVLVEEREFDVNFSFQNEQLNEPEIKEVA